MIISIKMSIFVGTNYRNLILMVKDIKVTSVTKATAILRGEVVL